jgi:hypothetical protein
MDLGDVAIRNGLLGHGWGGEADDLRAAVQRVQDYDEAFDIAFSVSQAGPR